MNSNASSVVALIGDLVGSRSQPSRSDVQSALLAALAAANDLVPGLQPLAATIGDEFQGVYETVEAASTAALVVRLALPEALDARAGLGVGAIQIVGESAYGLTQDGPAWWSARGAVVGVKRDERRLPGLRTAVAHAEGPEHQEKWMNAYLATRDAVVTRLDARQRRLVLGVLQGVTRADLADREGISASAVSQSLRRSGAVEVLHGVSVLGVRP